MKTKRTITTLLVGLAAFTMTACGTVSEMQEQAAAINDSVDDNIAVAESAEAYENGEISAQEQAALIGGIFFDNYLKEFNVEPGSVEYECLAQYKDEIVDGSNLTRYYIAKCAADVFVETDAMDTALRSPLQITSEQGLCIRREAMMYLVGLPEEEAVAALTAEPFPVEHLDPITTLVMPICGVNPEQIAGMVDTLP